MTWSNPAGFGEPFRIKIIPNGNHSAEKVDPVEKKSIGDECVHTGFFKEIVADSLGSKSWRKLASLMRKADLLVSQIQSESPSESLAGTS